MRGAGCGGAASAPARVMEIRWSSPRAGRRKMTKGEPEFVKHLLWTLSPDDAPAAIRALSRSGGCCGAPEVRREPSELIIALGIAGEAGRLRGGRPERDGSLAHEGGDPPEHGRRHE